MKGRRIEGRSTKGRKVKRRRTEDNIPSYALSLSLTYITSSTFQLLYCSASILYCIRIVRCEVRHFAYTVSPAEVASVRQGEGRRESTEGSESEWGGSGGMGFNPRPCPFLCPFLCPCSYLCPYPSPCPCLCCRL